MNQQIVLQEKYKVRLLVSFYLRCQEKKTFWLLPSTFTLRLPSFQWLCIVVLFLIEFQKQ